MARHIYNGDAVINAIKLGQRRKIDFIGLSDSNQVYNGAGWDHGFNYALSQHLTMYGTSILATQAPGNIGYLFNRELDGNWTNGTYGSNTGALAAHEAYMPLNFSSDYYGYSNIADAYTRNGFVNNAGMIVLVGCPLNISHNLRGHMWYGTFKATGDGYMSLGWRQSGGTSSNLAGPYDIDTEDGAFANTVLEATLDLAAGDRSSLSGVKFRYLYQDGSTRLNGKAWIGYQRVTDLDVVNGFSYHTFAAMPSESAYDLLYALTSGAASSNTFKQFFFKEATDEQGTSDRIAVFCINHGMNDQNETGTSIGPIGGYDNSSKDGYKDNILGIIAEIDARWQALGYDLNNCFYIVMPAHPYGSGTYPNYTPSTNITYYRDALLEISASNNRVCYADTWAKYSMLDMADNGYWYGASTTPQAHLSQAGYEAISADIFNELFTRAGANKLGNVPSLGNTIPSLGNRQGGG